MYLGANNSVHRMTRSIVALNHCYDTTGTLQGDGIEVKQGSHTNWIAENHVHDTIVNAGRTANLSSWDGRAGMVFANNAVYSRDAESVRFPGGSTGVTLAGNVVLGGVGRGRERNRA